MPVLPRILGILAATSGLSLAVWLGHYSRWSDVAYNTAAAKAAEKAASEDLAERRRLIVEEQLRESRKPKPAERSWRPEIVAKPPFPKFSIDEADFDFGTAHVGQAMTHIFEIQNVGRVPLVLASAPPGCGHEMVGGGFYRGGWRKELRMGERFDYRVQWTGHELNNNFVQGIHLLTNDPRHPDVYFKVSGRIIDPPKFVREDFDIP
ncbi:MAG TPA: DUF1573 domain-containing protein [Planctomycetaceae bacterium]|nr:DUF1573 domain-containing protein [Planctomycetaceae bacterium]